MEEKQEKPVNMTGLWEQFWTRQLWTCSNNTEQYVTEDGKGKMKQDDKLSVWARVLQLKTFSRFNFDKISGILIHWLSEYIAFCEPKEVQNTSNAGTRCSPHVATSRPS
jgi:hypothetical protein